VETLSACAWVRAENESAGAGFVIDVEKKLLITCRHLVADRKTVDVIFPWVRDGELVTDRRTYLGNRATLRELGLLVSGKVLKTSDAHDLALVELDSFPVGVKAVTFAANAPEGGDPLRVVGNRLDLDTVWNVTTGPARVSGRLADGYFWRGKKLAVNADVVVGQLPTEEGDSGGPVFDARGELVGMASALRRQCPLAAVCISGNAIRTFAGLPIPPLGKPKAPGIADTLTRATVWVRPMATDVHLAGVLLEPDLVLTCGKGLVTGDRAGIAFPLAAGEGKWIGERAAYRDPLGLHLKGNWRGGTVLARDTTRDLALIRLDSPVEVMRPVNSASRLPAPGDAVHTMNHPGGLEFAWMYAGGTVRQRGRIAIAGGEDAKPTTVIVCQLPAQSGSPGGPVLNDKGELVGILSSRESAQLVGYAITADEIAAFLDVALLERPAKTFPGLLARLESLPGWAARGTARGFARQAETQRVAGEPNDATESYRRAVALDPGCVPARLTRAKMLVASEQAAEAIAELDIAVERGPFDTEVLRYRSELAVSAKDWRKARTGLERILEVNPADADARLRLIGVLVELGEDVKAATAVTDTLRADPKRLKAVAVELLAQADTLAKKYPDAPSVPVGWLMKAIPATKRDEFTETLKRATTSKDDAERLTVLRDGLKAATGKP